MVHIYVYFFFYLNYLLFLIFNFLKNIIKLILSVKNQSDTLHV